MGMTDPRHIEQTWGSHMPFLTAMMETLVPTYAVECGCGEYSTPIIEKYAKSFLTIEHDAGWAKKVQKRTRSNQFHFWEVASFGGVHNSTRRCELTGSQLIDIERWYKAQTWAMNIPFLFIDTFTACRVPAMQNFSKYANIVMMHDMEGNSPIHYDFPLIGDLMDDWHRYRLAPEGKIDGQYQIPWTDVWSREPLRLEPLQRIVRREADKLWGPIKAEIEEITGKGWLND